VQDKAVPPLAEIALNKLTVILRKNPKTCGFNSSTQ
jgi:hypothetical protein